MIVSLQKPEKVIKSKQGCISEYFGTFFSGANDS